MQTYLAQKPAFSKLRILQLWIYLIQYLFSLLSAPVIHMLIILLDEFFIQILDRKQIHI